MSTVVVRRSPPAGSGQKQQQHADDVLAHDLSDLLVVEACLQQRVCNLHQAGGIERCCDRTIEVRSQSDVIDADDFSFETMTNATTGGQYFARPHGVAITDRYAFVSNENTNGEIPQHHPTDDDGPDGAVTVIDLQTQEVRKLLSVEVDPTGVAFVELP